jgi:hypothetical protein
MHYMNADLAAVLLVAALLFAIVSVIRSELRSLLAWACVLGFLVLAWDYTVSAGWF